MQFQLLKEVRFPTLALLMLLLSHQVASAVDLAELQFERAKLHLGSVPKWRSATDPEPTQSIDDISPVAVELDWRPTYEAAGQKYQVRGATVMEIKHHARVVDQISETAGSELIWLGSSNGIAFLARKPKDEECPDPVVLSLDLASMKWLEPYQLHRADVRIRPKRNLRTRLGRVVLSADCLYVLTYDLAEFPYLGELPVASSVMRLEGSPLQQVWRHDDKYSAEIRNDYTVRFHPRSLWETSCSLDPLSLLPDGGVVICAGEQEDLMCLEGTTGQERWRFNRLWEYEAGYSPHEYFEFITRFGVERIVEPPLDGGLEFEAERQRLAAGFKLRSRRFRREFEGSLAAGPLICTIDDLFNERTVLFIAGQRRRRSLDGFQQHFPETFIYKIEPLDRGLGFPAGSDSRIEQCWRIPYELSEYIAPMADRTAHIWFCPQGDILRLPTKNEPGDRWPPDIDWFKGTPAGERDSYFGRSNRFLERYVARWSGRLWGSDSSSTAELEFIDVLTGNGCASQVVVPGSSKDYFAITSVNITDDRMTVIISKLGFSAALSFPLGPIEKFLREKTR